MDERQIDNLSMTERLTLGVVSLAVGLMFLVPGVYFAWGAAARLIKNHELPRGGLAIVVSLMVVIGAALLPLSWSFFTGEITKRRIPTPVLVVVSIWFIAISLGIAVCHFAFNETSDHQVGRAIGGSFTIGVLGLLLAYKRIRRASNNGLHADASKAPRR
jgi:hypothetical protein